MHGDCHFEGTISCPYHGWTFDGDGNVLAVLPEGPDSQVPGKVMQRSYPTQYAARDGVRVDGRG